MKSSLIVSPLLGLSMAFATGCKSMPGFKSGTPPVQNVESASTNSEEPEFKPETLFKSSQGKNLAREFRSVQSELANANDRVLLFARCGDLEGKGPERLEKVKNPESWPEDRLVMYVFLLNSSNRVRLMQIVPNSESGDWYEQNDYLFGSDGSLAYWEHYYGSFHPEEPKKAWYAYAWSQNGSILDQAFKFQGPDGHAWRGANPKPPALPPLHLKALLEQNKLYEVMKFIKVE